MSDSVNDALNDEIEALTSIYDSPVLTILPPSSSTSATSSTSIPAILALPNDVGYTFTVNFSLDYPDTPPEIVGTHHVDASVKKGQGDVATTILRDVLARVYTPGQVCIFDLIEEATPLLLTSTRHTDDHQQQHNEQIVDNESCVTYGDEDGTFATGASVSSQPGRRNQNHTVGGSDMLESEPQWILSEALVVNKSTFVARCLHVNNLAEAQASIAHLVGTNKRVAAATHNISAWRIRQIRQTGTEPGSAAEITIQDSDDDGETAAGGRLLHLLQLMDVWNVLVVVSRWYGGVKLGPDRFRCINAVAREAVVNAGFGAAEKRKGKK